MSKRPPPHRQPAEFIKAVERTQTAHLPTVIQHGIEKHHDAGFSFCVPAGATGYQRWWRPEEIEEMVRNGRRHGERANTGCYRDGFGNLVDVHALANPPIERNWKYTVQVVLPEHDNPAGKVLKTFKDVSVGQTGELRL